MTNHSESSLNNGGQTGTLKEVENETAENQHEGSIYLILADKFLKRSVVKLTFSSFYLAWTMKPGCTLSLYSL